MLTMADMKYFIDPTPNHFEVNSESKRAMVFQSRYNRRHELPGTIVELTGTNRRLVWSGIDFLCSADGDYFRGAVANPTSVYYSYVVGTSPAHPGKFFTGYTENIQSESEGVKALCLGRSLVSTGEASPMSNGWTGTALSEWFRAAPWAMELMPSPADTDELVSRKLELAKARWEFNYALSVITIEGSVRGWSDQLETLAGEFNWLPTYSGTTTAEVTALVPFRRDSLTEAEQERFREKAREFHERTGGTLRAESHNSYASTTLRVILENPRVLQHGRMISPHSPGDITYAVRDKLGDRGALVDPFYGSNVMLARQSAYA